MNKVKVKDIPAALARWTEKPGDFWFGKCIRSLGYTRAELSALMKNNEEIDRAVKLAFESLFEKVIYNIAVGNIDNKLGDFIMLFFGQQLNIIKKREVKNYFFDCPHTQDYSSLVKEDSGDDEDYDELDEDDDGDSSDSDGEFKPFIKEIKFKNK